MKRVTRFSPVTPHLLLGSGLVRRPPAILDLDFLTSMSENIRHTGGKQ